MFKTSESFSFLGRLSQDPFPPHSSQAIQWSPLRFYHLKSSITTINLTPPSRLSLLWIWVFVHLLGPTWCATRWTLRKPCQYNWWNFSPSVTRQSSMWLSSPRLQCSPMIQPPISSTNMVRRSINCRWTMFFVDGINLDCRTTRPHLPKPTSNHKMVEFVSRRQRSGTSSRWSSSSWTRPCWTTWTTWPTTSTSRRLLEFSRTSHSARPWAWFWSPCWGSCFTSRQTWRPASSETSKTTSSRSSPLAAWSSAQDTMTLARGKWVDRGWENLKANHQPASFFQNGDQQVQAECANKCCLRWHPGLGGKRRDRWDLVAWRKCKCNLNRN